MTDYRVEFTMLGFLCYSLVVDTQEEAQVLKHSLENADGPAAPEVIKVD